MDFAASATKAHEKFTRELIAARLQDLWERTGDPLLHQILLGKRPQLDGPFANDLEYFDWISTAVMNCFKNTGDTRVFELLFDLNHEGFLHTIQAKVHRQSSHVDPQDVVQEVFL